MQKEIESALVDVRKAYRLIYLYMKSTRDTIERIVEKFDCNFIWWTPINFDSPPNRGTNPFTGNRWTWDMLPVFNTYFLYLANHSDRGSQKAGDWLLEICLESDDGFDDETEDEPDPTNFVSPDQCSSAINLSVYYCKKSSKRDWVNSIWDNFPEETDEDGNHYGDDGVVQLVGQRFQLSTLYKEDLIDNCVINFKEYVLKKIPKLTF